MAEKSFGRKVSRLLSFFDRSSSDTSCLVDMTSSSDYCHDIGAIKQSTLILDHNAKTLEKLQNEIVRRTKKDKNGLLGLYRSKYDVCLSRMRQEVKHLAVNIFHDGDELVSSMKNANDVLNSSSKVDRKTVLPQTVDRTTIVSTLKTNDDIWREEIQRMKAIVSRLTREVAAEEKAKEEALQRYHNTLAGRQLNHQPTLSDISPTDIVEMYVELQDVQWMDAYDELRSTMSDEETVRTLKDILMCAFDACSQLTEPLHLYLNTDKTKVNAESRQKVVSRLKQISMIGFPKVKEIVMPDIYDQCGLASLGCHMTSYIEMCVKVCWLMVIQEPPMYLDQQKPDNFDLTKYTWYTESGPYVAYIVWPAIFRRENGSMLGRGVAQGAPAQGSREVKSVNFECPNE